MPPFGDFLLVRNRREMFYKPEAVVLSITDY